MILFATLKCGFFEININVNCFNCCFCNLNIKIYLNSFDI